MSAIVLVQHPVGKGPFSDFDAWRAAFDRDPADRAGHGARRHWIYRSPESDYVVIVLEFDTLEEADTFKGELGSVLGEVWAAIGADSPARVLELVENVDY